MATKKTQEDNSTVENFQSSETPEARNLGLSDSVKARQKRLAKTVGDASEFPHNVNFGDDRPKHGELLAEDSKREG